MKQEWGVALLSNHLESGTTLDLIASGFTLDHDTTLGRVTRASTTVDKEARTTAHGVGSGGVELIAVVHALKGLHVAKCVRSRRQRAYTNLALAAGIVAAGTRLTAATARSVDVGAVESRSIETMGTDVIGIWAASRHI